MKRLLAVSCALAFLAATPAAFAKSPSQNMVKHSVVSVKLHNGANFVTSHGVTYVVTVAGGKVVSVTPKSTGKGHKMSAMSAPKIMKEKYGDLCYECWYDADGNLICIVVSC